MVKHQSSEKWYSPHAPSYSPCMYQSCAAMLDLFCGSALCHVLAGCAAVASKVVEQCLHLQRQHQRKVNQQVGRLVPVLHSLGIFLLAGGNWLSSFVRTHGLLYYDSECRSQTPWSTLLWLSGERRTASSERDRSLLPGLRTARRNSLMRRSISSAPTTARSAEFDLDDI